MVDRWLDRVAGRPVAAVALLVLVTLAAVLPGFATLFPMDRDEPRFAQATKQMLESGDYVDIRFHDEARNKKPVGIYWLQAGAVATGAALGVPAPLERLWLYRLPSLLGAVTAVLLTFWSALALTSRRAALLSALMMATCVLLVVEAHLAKTDAALLATVVAAMGVLARAFVARGHRAPLPWWLVTLFWAAIAIGLLLKGPITPMVPLFAALVLSARERSMRWLLPLRPALGLLGCLLAVAPWFVLIVKHSGMAFFAESIGHDMAAKVASGQESHGAPLGTYAAAFWVTGWPFAPFVLLAAPIAWRDRRSDRVAFLLAWIVPTWLLFETVPTKLPHYVLPIYPALAMLAASSLLESRGPAPGGLRLGLFALALALVPAGLPIALILMPGRIASAVEPSTIGLAAVVILVLAGCVALAVRCARRQAWGGSIASAGLACIALCALVFGWILNTAHADLLALSPRLADAGRAASHQCSNPAFATVGDREPSLVFLTGTTLLMTDAGGAALFLQGGSCRVAFVERPAEAAFIAALSGDPRIALASRVVGVNINGGRTLDVGIYVRQDGAS